MSEVEVPENHRLLSDNAELVYVGDKLLVDDRWKSALANRHHGMTFYAVKMMGVDAVARPTAPTGKLPTVNPKPKKDKAMNKRKEKPATKLGSPPLGEKSSDTSSAPWNVWEQAPLVALLIERLPLTEGWTQDEHDKWLAALDAALYMDIETTG